MRGTLTPGAAIIYRRYRTATRLRRKAQDIFPSANGDSYTFAVDKYYRVEEVLPDGRVVVRTRRGKRRTLNPADPAMRRPSWWEWLWCWHRFPPAAPPPAGGD
ncbi:MAG: hypothetical protein ACRC33_30370 [Gemmataceae bacterium]